MIYTLIISILIEKPFYLLSPQSFSFQIVSEFIDILWNSLTLCPRGGVFDSLFCPEMKEFCTQWLSWGGFFAPFTSCLGGLLWMKLIPAIYSNWHQKTGASHFMTSQKLDRLAQHPKKPQNQNNTPRWKKINSKSISDKSKIKCLLL